MPVITLESGDAAPSVQMIDSNALTVNLDGLWQSGPTLLTFLRHFG